MKHPCVLVVDEHRDVRHAIALLLRENGCEVFESPTAVGASAELVRLDADALVIGNHLSMMKGGRFAELVRQNPRFAELALVVVCAEAEAPEPWQADAVLPESASASDVAGAVLRLLPRDTALLP
jgi:CheY-like chemotaxis protein